jgi:hypothetical protein
MKFGVYINKPKAVECGYLSASGVSPWRSDAVPFDSLEDATAKITSMGLQNTTNAIPGATTAYVCNV